MNSVLFHYPFFEVKPAHLEILDALGFNNEALLAPPPLH